MPTDIKQHLSMLGLRAKDRVTGAEGVIVSVSFDLYGCIQVVLNPGIDKDGKQREQGWYDIARMEALDPAPVMPQPDYAWTGDDLAAGRKGPADKPSFNR